MEKNMSEYLKQSTEATEQYLSVLARTHEQILDTVKKTPVFPAPVTTDFQAPADVPSFPVSAASPREVAEAALEFTEKLIGQQKAFMKQYFDIAEGKLSEAQATTADKPAEAKFNESANKATPVTKPTV
jgi:hypothetical protein